MDRGNYVRRIVRIFVGRALKTRDLLIWNSRMDQRPNPDQLLKHVQADEKSVGRGRLKLFFGAGPGVGKTYAMLEATRQRKKEGWDVVIGLVETHGRAETEASHRTD